MGLSTSLKICKDINGKASKADKDEVTTNFSINNFIIFGTTFGIV